MASSVPSASLARRKNDRPVATGAPKSTATPSIEGELHSTRPRALRTAAYWPERGRLRRDSESAMRTSKRPESVNSAALTNDITSWSSRSRSACQADSLNMRSSTNTVNANDSTSGTATANTSCRLTEGVRAMLRRYSPAAVRASVMR